MRALVLRLLRAVKARLAGLRSRFVLRPRAAPVTAPAAEDLARAEDARRMQALAGPEFEVAMAEAGGFAVWHEGRRASCRQFTEAALSGVGALAAVVPGEVARARRIGDRVARHEFNFLGSGPFTPVDPDRPAGADGYQPIDWVLDPVRGLRFPRRVLYKTWNLFEMRPGNADIKYPWELSRCQHFLALGQAYAVSGEDAYALELVAQATDYCEANPIGLGVNWTCTMDVALGAANWCFAFALIKSCAAIPLASWERLYRHLHDTARFVLQNLENKYEVTSNHFLSNVVGLHVLASEFSDLGQASSWDAFARDALEREIVVQILPDGADYESSVPYHRLVSELFLGSCRLADVQGKPLSTGYSETLEKMLTFLEATLRPDGRMPVVGDADDGRLLVATGYGEWDPGDGRHILGPAARTLERPDWLARRGESDIWEMFWWGFPDAPASSAHEASSPARLFPDAGLAVSLDRAGGGYLLASNGIVGTRGFGNHKHNDLLSFEYHDKGVALIIDPGTYVYTSDFAARNAFRSTSRHNTVMIDGVEQNEFKADWLFRMFEKAKPQHLLFEALANGMVYEGSHDGYEAQLPEGVTHVRRFECHHLSGRLLIKDILRGAGIHTAEWRFHFDPALAVELVETERCALLRVGELKWRLVWADPAMGAKIVAAEVSPSYGLKRPSFALVLERDIELSAPTIAEFTIERVA